MSSYSAIMTCTRIDEDSNAILFAEHYENKTELLAATMKEILRLMDDECPRDESLKLHYEEDVFGEQLIVANCGSKKFVYKCFVEVKS